MERQLFGALAAWQGSGTAGKALEWGDRIGQGDRQSYGAWDCKLHVGLPGLKIAAGAQLSRRGAFTVNWCQQLMKDSGVCFLQTLEKYKIVFLDLRNIEKFVP